MCPVGVALFAYAAPARNQRHFYFVSFSESLFRRPNSPRGLSEESQATSRRSRIRRLAVSFCIHRDTDVVSRWCFRTWGGSSDLRFRCWSCPAWHWCDRSDRCRRRRRAVPGAVKITHRVPPSVAARSTRVTRCLPTEARDGRGFVHPGHHHPYPRRPVFHDGRGDARSHDFRSSSAFGELVGHTFVIDHGTQTRPKPTRCLQNRGNWVATFCVWHVWG